MKKRLQAIFGSYTEIFFLQSPALGLLVFAITLLNPRVALMGILSTIAAYGAARFIRMEKSFLESGFYTYNPLLVGLSLGYLFEITPITAFFVIAAGIFTLIVTLVAAHLFLAYLKLPILSLPFVIVSSIAHLASLKYPSLLVKIPRVPALLAGDLGLPYWIAGYFTSFGAILFSPSVMMGMLFALVTLCSSRILFMLSVMGYYVGALARAWMLGSPSTAFADLTNFNFILIGMAVGGVFLIPSLGSYLLAAVAVVISTMFLDAISVAWSMHGLPIFALPFNVVCLGFIYALRLLEHPLVAAAVGRNPEETLENHLANRLRYPGQQRTLFLPFSGKWTVWQGFDGAWTHKGSWQYAYDFVITDEKGQTHSGSGAAVEDYYCHRKPVLAPVRGRVAHLVNDLPDNSIGQGDKTRNWGNLVVLHDPRGFYVELSHFAAQSIHVKKGDWVERGAVLGLCGNSGYSPQPHIHVQVQLTDQVGCATAPFSFVSYVHDNEYYANDLPLEKQRVEPLYPDKHLDGVTHFVLDETQHYRLYRDDHRIADLRLSVRMAPDGAFYFQSELGTLYFGKHEGTFYFYRVDGADPWLRLLFLALPRLPLGYRDGLGWRDYAPIGVALGGLRRALADLLNSFLPNLARIQCHQTFLGPHRIRSVIQSRIFRLHKSAEVELDAHKGFARIKIDNIEFKRTYPEPI